MPTPSLQTLVTDAQQVLNLDSISAVRSVVAVALANANTGTPLNPNLTTQQLWNEFYQVVTKPKSDIESIIANQLMKFLYAPPAPGGVGANGQVIFNNNGVLAGGPQFLWNKTTNLLTITGAATITGDLTVDTSTLKVNSSTDRVGIKTTNLFKPLTVEAGSTGSGTINQGLVLNSSAAYGVGQGVSYSSLVFSRNRVTDTSALYPSCEIFGGNALETSSDGGVLGFSTSNTSGTLIERMRIDQFGNLGLGVTPSAWGAGAKMIDLGAGSAVGNAGSTTTTWFSSNSYQNGTNWIYKNSAAASYYAQLAGQHQWHTAASGTAGNAITFTQAMTLDASGNLLVGTTSGTFRGQFIVASGADRSILQAGVTGMSGGFQVKWVNATSKINVIIENIPTSSAGLAAGTLWNDAGTIKIA